MQTTLQAMTTATLQLDRTRATLEKRSDIAREVEYFTSRIMSVKSADALVADRRLLGFIADAFGLGDLRSAGGLIKKLMVDGSSPDGLAARMVDQRFRDLAATFDFKRFGASTTETSAVRDGVPARFLRHRLEQAAGRENDAVRLALYFDRKAPEVRTPYGILADKALLDVVTTALGLPQQFRTLDIDRQAATLSRLVDVDKWRDPKARRDFLERFAVRRDMAAPPTTSGLSTIALPVGPSSSVSQLNETLLMKWQSSRRAR
jgi:hypothetical protein